MGGGPFYLETTNIIQTKDQAVEEEEYDSEYEDEASEDIEEGDEDGDAKNKKINQKWVVQRPIVENTYTGSSMLIAGMGVVATQHIREEYDEEEDCYDDEEESDEEEEEYGEL